MRNFRSIYLKSPFLCILLALILILALSFQLRRDEFDKVTGSDNLPASYHVLLTIQALRSSSVKNHFYLPTVTLGAENDKNIPWGRTTPTKTGDYVYTSFTPPGFLAPYAIFSIFSINPSIKSLAYFNAAVGAIASVLLYLFLFSLFSTQSNRPTEAAAASFFAVFVSIFSREALQSHGLVYWSQSLYQILLISTVWALSAYANAITDRERFFRSAVLCTLVFMGAWTEWTGYITGIGIFFLLRFYDPPSSQTRNGILVALFLALFITVLHYGLAIGFVRLILISLERSIGRGVAQGSFADLLDGYSISFGYYLLIVLATAVALIYVYINSRSSNFANKHQWRDTQRFLIIFVAALIPLLENIAMLQHASEWTFDRLKFVLPSSILVGSAFFIIRDFLFRTFLIIAVIYAAFSGFNDYREGINKFSDWINIDGQNTELVSRINSLVNVECAVILTTMDVRGYTNLIFNRGVYEFKSRDDGAELMQNRNACASIFVNAEPAYPGLPRFIDATIQMKDGDVVFLKAQSS